MICFGSAHRQGLPQVKQPVWHLPLILSDPLLDQDLLIEYPHQKVISAYLARLVQLDY